MNPKTEIRLYELAFGENARPEHLNDLDDAIKRPSFTEADLIDHFKEIDNQSFLFEKILEALQINGYDINKGVSN